MIAIGENWRIESDKYNWILVQIMQGKDKDGNEKLREKRTYHSTFKHLAAAIIDREIRGAESLPGIIQIMGRTEDLLAAKIESTIK